MTRMMVRIDDAGEAAEAAAAGLDSIELAVSRMRPGDDDLRAVRSAFPGCLRLGLDATDRVADVVELAMAMGADEIAIPVGPASGPSLPTERPPGLRFIARVAAASVTSDAVRHLRPLVDAIMLDAGPETRIFDSVGITDLDAFASACRRHALAFGISGGLEAPDVSRLLLLGPDVLGFESAVRVGHDPNGPLDPVALRTIRALIPRHDGKMHQPHRSGRAVVDRIFVRDFVVALSIGAYQAEHGKRQRVRFSVEADVSREPGSPRDMRDVFSYDVIIETIRVLAERTHVTFVETLAEEVATSLLAHPALLSTKVTVEKLDVIEGSVGIEIHRHRQA